MDNVNYEFRDCKNGYNIYRAIIAGKGHWQAVKTSAGKEVGEPFPITYEQAIGRQPIDNSSALAMFLGRILLP